MNQTVLLIEDDPDTENVVRYFLTSAGFRFEAAPTGYLGLKRLSNLEPDAVVLDLNLPDVDGTVICQQIRDAAAIPILMLTGRGTEVDMLRGFDLGADDYVTKPFKPKELVARVRAVLRRTRPDPLGGEACGLYSLGGITVDVAHHRVEVCGEEVRLTRTEMRILTLLLKEPGRLVSREEIMVNVYGNTYERDERTVDTHVSHLRRKLQRGRGETFQIQNIYGLGYKILGE